MTRHRLHRGRSPILHDSLGRPAGTHALPRGCRHPSTVILTPVTQDAPARPTGCTRSSHVIRVSMHAEDLPGPRGRAPAPCWMRARTRATRGPDVRNARLRPPGTRALSLRQLVQDGERFAENGLHGDRGESRVSALGRIAAFADPAPDVLAAEGPLGMEQVVGTAADAQVSDVVGAASRARGDVIELEPCRGSATMPFGVGEGAALAVPFEDCTPGRARHARHALHARRVRQARNLRDLALVARRSGARGLAEALLLELREQEVHGTLDDDREVAV